MICPRCQQALDEKEHDGVTIDRCTQCRGIWLDRGELEKLIARATNELADIETREARANALRRADSEDGYVKRRADSDDGFARRRADSEDGYIKRRADSDDGYGQHGGQRHSGQPRKRSWLQSLGDIFGD